MPRTNYRIGVALIVAAVLSLAALLAGHRSADAPVSSHTHAASNETAITEDTLPEVVITAERATSETVTLVDRDADVTAGSSPLHSRHR